MYRFIAIALLTLLPLQFSWAAVAAYCGHETEAGAAHFGHHAHPPHADIGAGPLAEPGTPTEASGEEAPGALELDCGHCHSSCGVMPSLGIGPPDALSTVQPSAALDESGAACAPTRPERPQWRPLA
ncbi:hypothetical protein IP87_01550 [beta proteobacterium AAP121]|nr:hypothetical protein IP80_02450 [beta proteobacterium AAP65]KPG00690.1 hypothetical protein IP87_01550 [beta proteobacterium AAP121]